MFQRMHSGKISMVTYQGYAMNFHFQIINVIIVWSYNYYSFSPETCFIIFRGVDHQTDGNCFATAGAQVDIWNHNRLTSELVCKFFVQCATYSDYVLKMCILKLGLSL